MIQRGVAACLLTLTAIAGGATACTGTRESQEWPAVSSSNAPDLTGGDLRFITSLRAENLAFGTDATMLATGYAVCDHVRARLPADQVRQKLSAASGFDDRQVRIVTVAALTFLCADQATQYYDLGN